ncbi:MAG: glycosyltransferase, partial [SAR202 cluster bacterium]|nr:glycosyltransferase [SAR202 cluster bacterium]
QSFQDFELIVIDDGSTDDSRLRIKKFENKEKIKVIYQNKRGLTISNNIALNQARGEYIIRLDADDYLDKNALKILLNEFDTEEIGMVFGDWYVINRAGEVISIEKRHNFTKDVSMYDQPAHGACTMFRTKYLREIGGYDESITRQDGYELWFRLIERYEIRNINVPVFYYRKHGNSLTDKSEQLLETRSEILKKIFKRKNIVLPKIVAIFPVRGEKLDNRSKPFMKLKKSYLIDISINNFLEVEGIDLIIVSSPDKKVLDYISKNYNSDKVLPLKRPLDISYIGIHIKQTMDLICKEVDLFNNYDAFILHSIEAPFVKKHLIESAINIYKIFQVDTVIAVKEDNRFFFKHDGHGMVPLNYSHEIIRNEKEKWYAAVSNFLLRDKKKYFEAKEMMGNKIGHVIFDKKASLLIEDNLDLEIAKLIV